MEEINIAAEAADKIDPTGKTKYILLFLFGTGLRICEFTSLTTNDFNFKKKNVIHVPRECTKNKKGVRDVYVDPKLLQLLKTHCTKNEDPNYQFISPYSKRTCQDKIYNLSL